MPTTQPVVSSPRISFEDTSVAFATKSDIQLKKMYVLFGSMNKNWLVKLGTFFIKLSLWLHFPINKLIKYSVFEQFCGGESLQECNNTIENLDKANIGTILDYSVEGKETEKSFEEKCAVGRESRILQRNRQRAVDDAAGKRGVSSRGQGHD